MCITCFLYFPFVHCEGVFPVISYGNINTRVSRFVSIHDRLQIRFTKTGSNKTAFTNNGKTCNGLTDASVHRYFPGDDLRSHSLNSILETTLRFPLQAQSSYSVALLTVTGCFQAFSVEITLESRGELDLDHIRSIVDKAGGSVYGTGK